MMWTAALVTVVSLFTLVAFHVFAAQSAFTLERLSKERTNEQLRYERLREQVASFSSAQTIIAASKSLGMVPGPSIIELPVAGAGPRSATIVTLPSESSSLGYDEAKQALDPTG
jgi:hypothetical protein